MFSLLERSFGSRQTLGLNRSLLGCSVFLVQFVLLPLAWPQSVYVDFDGSGGSSYSGSSAPPIPSDRGSYSHSYSSSRTRSGRSDYPVYSEYENQLREEQVREARRRRELEERIKRARSLNDLREEQQLLTQLRQLQGNADNDFEEMQQTAKVINALVPAFEQEQQQVFRQREPLLQRLAHEMDHIVVPSPNRRCSGERHSRILIRGMFYTPAQAQRDRDNGLTDPFTGESFCDIFGFGSESVSGEAARVSFEHFLQNINVLSSNTWDQLRRLKGATVEEIVCHSNGCAVAEVLIRTHFVNQVKTLRILGGDAAITNLDSIKKLQEQTGVRVEVYAVKGDPVPLVPTGWQIIDAVRRIGGPLKTFESANSLTYQVLGLESRSGFNPTLPLQIQFLTPPIPGEPSLNKHEWLTYAGIVAGQRLAGFRSASGDMRSDVIILH